MSTSRLSSVGRIVRRRLLAQEINRLPDAGVAELDLWNDDAVELVRDPRCPAGIAREGVTDRADRLAVLADRLFPSFLDLPKLAASGFR